MKCKVCGKHFRLKNSKRYTISVAPSLADAITGRQTIKIKEAFDCSWCGCQNIVNTREQSYISTDESSGKLQKGEA